MGPPDKMPVFPMYDRFNIPGVRLVPGPRWPAKCNWLQIQENTMDPAHTATLHAIPQLRGTDHFATEFGNFPELITWAETPAGYIYMAVRQMGENVWVRSAEALGPTMRCISSIFENGATRKPASLPFMSFWILPVDDDETCHFFVSHVSDEETMPFEQRRALENFGQLEDRPYHERQFLPGDYEAQVGQGPVNNHGAEHLATMDRGISIYRRYLRRNIALVEEGRDPEGVYYSQDEVPPTFTNDYVTGVAEIGGDPNDPSALEAFCRRLVKNYLINPPMAELIRKRTQGS
jgi:hypothetical protein